MTLQEIFELYKLDKNILFSRKIYNGMELPFMIATAEELEISDSQTPIVIEVHNGDLNGVHDGDVDYVPYFFSLEEALATDYEILDVEDF